MKTNFEKIKETLGVEVYEEIEKIVKWEIGIAKDFVLEIERLPQYYRSRFLLPDFVHLYEIFEEKWLEITPDDFFTILFKCRMLSICKSNEEYYRRTWVSSYFEDHKFINLWQSKDKWYEESVEQCLQEIYKMLEKRTLMTQISLVKNFDKIKNSINLKEFLESIMAVLWLPYSFVENEKWIYVGFTCFWSHTRCYWFSCQLLRTFMSVLKIAAFRYPVQIDVWEKGIEILPTTSPVFRESWYTGWFDWHENERKPFLRYPDGYLFRSFGNRSVSKTWLDIRNLEWVKNFFLKNKIIFDKLKNPWSEEAIYDIATSIDLLSSSTQSQDLGTKILLLYCSLEHLFVPIGMDSENKRYILWAINALQPSFLPWFQKLYKMRCDYAHKWYILDNSNEVIGFIMDSMEKILDLLTLKLKSH